MKLKPLRSYNKVKEILDDNKLSSETGFYAEKPLYRFFNVLQESVYNGESASELRERLNLPVIDVSEINKSSTIVDVSGSMSTATPPKQIIPYWEIHLYNEGFTNHFNAPDYFDKNDEEKHFYFTLRSLIPDSHYNELKLKSKDVLEFKEIHQPFIADRELSKDEIKEFQKYVNTKTPTAALVLDGVWGPKTKSYFEKLKTEYGFETYEVYYTGRRNCKINKDYTGEAMDQYLQGTWRIEDHIQIVIIEDSNNNFDYLNKLQAPGKIQEYFNKNKKETSGLKLTSLPQMLFISYGSNFKCRSLQNNSIVCLDSYTSLTCLYGSALNLKGNIFLNRNSIIILGEVGKEAGVGENCIFQSSEIIGNVIIEDNVVIGKNHMKGIIPCKISRYCILTENVNVLPDKFFDAPFEIPAFQIITTKSTLFIDNFAKLLKA